MKTKLMELSLTGKIRFIGTKVVVAVAGIGIIALGMPTLASAKNYAVKLSTGKPGVLQVNVEKGQKCKKGKHPGCLLFEEGKIGNIKFYLPGSEKLPKNCDKTNRVITRIQLTATSMDGNSPEATKGDFDGSELPAWLKNEAFSSVNLKTGIAYEAIPASTGQSQVVLRNTNNHDFKEGPRQFWYKVTVSDCKDKDVTWATDPRGDNEGTRH